MRPSPYLYCGTCEFNGSDQCKLPTTRETAVRRLLGAAVNIGAGLSVVGTCFGVGAPLPPIEFLIGNVLPDDPQGRVIGCVTHLVIAQAEVDMKSGGAS